MDDPAPFIELHRLASADPVKFAQTSLITHSGNLSKAHLDYLQGLQDAINKQDPQAIAANTQVNDAVNTVREEMRFTGIDLNPEAGSDREKQLAQAESGLRDRIIAAQQANNGKPLTSGEVHNLAMGYFADQALKGGVAGKSGDGKQPQVQGGTQPGGDTKNYGGEKYSRTDLELYSPGVQETLTQHSQDVVDLLKQMSGMNFKVTSGRRDMAGQVRAMVNNPFAQGKADGTYKKNPTALKLYAWYKGMHKGGLSNDQISNIFINVLSLDKKLGAQFAASMPHMAGSPDTYQAIDIGPHSIDRTRWVEFKNVLNQLHEAGVLRKPALVPAEIADKRNEKDSSFHFEVNQHLTPEQQRAYDQLIIDTYLK